MGWCGLALTTTTAVIIYFGRLVEIDAVYGDDIFTIVHIKSCKFIQQFWKLSQKIRKGETQLYVSDAQDR